MAKKASKPAKGKDKEKGLAGKIAALEKEFKEFKDTTRDQVQQLSDRNAALLRMEALVREQMQQLSDRNSALLRLEMEMRDHIQQLSERNTALLRKVATLETSDKE